MPKIIKCFTIDKETYEALRRFLKSHPEFRNMSHLVEYAIKKFIEEESGRQD